MTVMQARQGRSWCSAEDEAPGLVKHVAVVTGVLHRLFALHAYNLTQPILCLMGCFHMHVPTSLPEHV